MSPPAAVSIDSAHPYDDLTSAAVTTLRGLQRGAVQNEQAGLIVRDPTGKYYATSPQKAAEDNFALSLKLAQGWNLAGIYHTHPGADSLAEYFSPGDVATANGLKVPSFVRFLKDDSIRQYTPGVTKTSRIGDRNSTDYLDTAYGDPIAAPSDPELQQVQITAQKLAQALTANTNQPPTMKGTSQ